MVKFNLGVNQKIEVIKDETNYKSLIIDVDEDSIKINVPINNGDYLFLKKGEEVEINTYAGDGKCFYFAAEVIEKGKEDGIPCYTLSEAYNIRRIQRRNFFRVDVYNNIQVKNVTGLHESSYSEIEYKNTLMLDLSSGGARIITQENYEINDLLLVRMTIKEKEMRLKSEVIRCEEKESGQKVYGIRFLNITQSQADKIIEELFQIMRKRRAALD